MESAELIASRFKIRASSCIDIMAPIGLTDNQLSRLKELEDRYNGVGKPLTDKMKVELSDLVRRRDNPEISEGAKTYCKNWLKGYLYGRRKDVKSKYIDKGNSTEEDGFTLMATELIGDMVYKNTERRSNEWCEGECDLFHKGIVYDNKSSWDLSTFPMFETEIPDKKYWWQLQVYAWLWEAEKAVLSYTLNDADRDMIEQALRWVINHDEAYRVVQNMVFTKDSFEYYRDEFFFTSELNSFIEIPDSARIKKFDVVVEVAVREKIKLHVELCRQYIISLLK